VRAITVLLNARAGGWKSQSVGHIVEAFRAVHCAADIRAVPGDSVAAAAETAVSAGAETVVAAGGDGTVSAVASALAGTRSVLGVLPLGTLNHFAKDLGIPLDLNDAVKAIAAGRATRIDVGELNGRPFINNVSIGMYATVVAQRTALQRAGRAKWMAQALAALRVWNHYQQLRVVLRAGQHEERVRTPFVFVGNNEYQLSGLELGGRTVLTGGRLHVCMAPGMSQRGVAHMIIATVFGHVSRLDAFESFTTPAVTADLGVPRTRAAVDGEVAAVENPLTFGVRPRALQVIVP
jgi:diacylglycerol kinase family enzyme